MTVATFKRFSFLIAIAAFPGFAQAGLRLLPELNVGADSASLFFGGDPWGEALGLWIRGRWLYRLSGNASPDGGAFLELGLSSHLKTLTAISGPDADFKQYELFLNWRSRNKKLSNKLGASLGAGVSAHYWSTADQSYQLNLANSFSVSPEFTYAVRQNSELALRAGVGLIFDGLSVLDVSRSNRRFGELVYRSRFASGSTWDARVGIESFRLNSAGGVAEFRSINASVGVFF